MFLGTLLKQAIYFIFYSSLIQYLQAGSISATEPISTLQCLFYKQSGPVCSLHSNYLHHTNERTTQALLSYQKKAEQYHSGHLFKVQHHNTHVQTHNQKLHNTRPHTPKIHNTVTKRSVGKPNTERSLL